MKTSVQARLDRRSQVTLKRLVQHLGWSPSKVVREGLQLLDVYYGKPAGKRIQGIGRFDSGLMDLAFNKKHLDGFGR
jgi:CobQ-like glutamine amidotransferase family enzyme